MEASIIRLYYNGFHTRRSAAGSSTKAGTHEATKISMRLMTDCCCCCCRHAWELS